MPVARNSAMLSVRSLMRRPARPGLVPGRGGPCRGDRYRATLGQGQRAARRARPARRRAPPRPARRGRSTRRAGPSPAPRAWHRRRSRARSTGSASGRCHSARRARDFAPVIAAMDHRAGRERVGGVEAPEQHEAGVAAAQPCAQTGTAPRPLGRADCCPERRYTGRPAGRCGSGASETRGRCGRRRITRPACG